MSNDYISGLLEAQSEGKLDTYNPTAPVTLEPEETVPANVTIETEANTVKPEVDLEQVKEITDEFSTLEKFGIYGQAFGGEIITNVATTATLVKGLGYLNEVKNISKIGILAPEGTSTIGGLITYAGAEAIGGVAGNLVNQSILKAYGVDKTEGYNLGELVTSGVFNVGLVHKPVEAGVDLLAGLAKDGKIFSFVAPSLQSLKAWRGGEYVVKGTKQFVSGATIGLAESVLRQSIEGTLNLDEDSTFDLLFSSLAGGTVQSAFSLLLSKGKAGRTQVVDIVEDAKSKLDDKKEELLQKKKDSKLKGKQKIGFENKVDKEISEVETAQDILDDSLESIENSNSKIDAREKELGATELTAEEVLEPKPIEEPEPVTPKPEEPEVKLEEEPTVVEEPVYKGFRTDAGDAPLDTDFIRAGGQFTEMTPDEYIDKVVDEFAKKEGLSREDVLSTRDIQEKTYIKDQLENNEAYPLTLDTTKDFVDQEGLNRALWAKELGIEKVPVIVNASEFLSKPKPAKVKPKIEVEEPVVEKPINVDEPAEVPEVTETVKRERFVDDVREDKLEELEAIQSRLESTPGKGSLTLEAPKLHRAGKKLADETAERVSNLIRILTKNYHSNKSIDIDVAKELLNEIKFTRRINKNIIDWWNTLGARLLQSQQKRDYTWEGQYSERAQLQDEALSKLEATLEAKTKGIVDGDEADIQSMFDEYLAIPDQLKAKYKKPVETEEDEFIEVFKEPKISEEVDVETKPTKEVKQNLGKQKKKLQEKLSELQKRFGDRSKLALAETGEELAEDADITDLKQRIKFYEQAEADVLELEKLEAELARVAELDVAPLGEQRAAVTPKPTGPKKVNIKAAKLRKRISDVKRNIKQRLDDIDRARLEMTEEFQVAKAEEAVNNRLSKLQSELDELRETFGREPKELVPGKAKEKDPRVKELEDKIKFYKEAQNEIRKIKELEVERARLLEIETGPLGRQREEITPKPTGPKKAPGRVEELNKDIAFLRKNMRNRVREIDRARVEMSDEFRAEQLRKAYEKKRTKLEGELDGLRKRFAEIDEEEAAAGLAPKKKKEDPRLTELKAKIKFYREAEKEAKLVADLEKELARVADIEGRSVVGEVRAEITPTPKGPTKPARSQELRKKIADSKARMRKKIADLDKARKEIEDAQLNTRIFKEIEDALHKQLEADTSSKITRGWRFIQSLRQQALIDQLPSVLAGIPTGLGAVYKQFFRPVTTFIYNADNVSLPIRTRLALSDLSAAFKILTDRKGLWTEMRRTFAENASPIDNRAGKLSDEMSVSKAPRGTHALVSRAYTSAKRRAEALENVSNAFNRLIRNGDLFYIMSLGVRGIQTVDSVFKRQLIKSRMYSRAQKQAILEFPNDPKKAKARADEIYNAQWKEVDGLLVLKEKTDFEDEVNQIREELLFAADGDLEDMPFNTLEEIINFTKKIVNNTGLPGAVIDAFAPYIGVPFRSIYRGAKYTIAPAQVLVQGGASKIPGLRGQINPFSRKYKELELKLRFEFDLLKKLDDPEKIKAARERIKNLTERRDKTAERRLRYNEELLTDAMVSTSLFAMGGMVALYYGGTGSLEWLTPEQRKNNKLESFKFFGMDYSAALPWAFPLALSADVASWLRIKMEERETGKTILTKDQTLAFVIGSSFKKLAEAMPLAQGVQTAQEIAQFEGDITKNAISRLVASYVPIPAQARKVNNTINQKGIPDLRGGSYWDRVVYAVLGSGVDNLKTNRLGEDEQSTANWVTQNIIRQAPRDELIRTEFDKIVATDTHKNLSNKPSMLTGGIKMTEWVNEDGMTLSYAFDQRLKRKVVKVKLGEKVGFKNYTIKQAVGALIKQKDWIKDYSEGFQEDSETGRFINKGLKRLNSVLNQFYTETKKEIIEDSRFLNKFVNEDDESLYYLLQTRGATPEPVGRPVSPLEILTR